MALTAAVATAVAIFSAGLALGRPAWIVAGLAAGVALVAVNPSRPIPRAGHHVRDLMVLTAVGTVVVVLIEPAPDDYPTVAGYVLLVPLFLALLWPAPVVMRYSLLVAGGCLAAAGGPLTDHIGPTVLFAASAAAALVALNRLTTPAAATGATAAPVSRERVAGEAAALFLIAGLAGLIVAALLPPPSGGGGSGRNRPGGGGGGGRADALPQYLYPTHELDAGGTGTGEGDELLFRVTARESALWRTMTFDAYDGRVWTRSLDVVDPPDQDFVTGRTAVSPGIGDGTGGRTLDQHVKIETEFVSLLPAALRPESIDADFSASLPDATLQGFLGKGDSYDVTSRVPPTEPDALRPHDARSAAIPLEVRRLYQPFPGLPSRVPALAAEIAAGAGATTEYDQVTAVVDWMRANTVVKAATRALPRDADPIDQYLFVDRAGSSQQAATATALLLRTLGVPTRLAVGYLPGDRSPLSGDFVVRARHAHAWIETWFPQVGWVGFDPAGRFLGPEPAGDSLLDRLLRLWWVLVILVLLVLAVVAWRLLSRRRRLRARPWATQTYERLTRAGSRHGRPRRPSETPAEYCEALAADVADRRLVEVGQLVTAAAWSRGEPPLEARAWADEVVAATEASAPRRRDHLRLRRRGRPPGPGATGQNMPAG